MAINTSRYVAVTAMQESGKGSMLAFYVRRSDDGVVQSQHLTQVCRTAIRSGRYGKDLFHSLKSLNGT